MNIVVYTALFGNIDPLWAAYPDKSARYVAFTDTRRVEAPLPAQPATAARWEQRLVKAEFGARRTARYYKTNAHLFFPEADVTIWLDANVRLRLPASQAVARWLHHDLATCDHPQRHCLYAEAAECAALHKGDPAVLQGQAAAYRAWGMPEQWGLAETRVVVRRQTPAQAELNAAWWTHITRYSERDQVSLPFVCWQHGVTWDVIPGRVWSDKHPFFWHTRHAKGAR
jgi:hypothetical protein